MVFGLCLFGNWICGTPHILEHGIRMPRPANQTTYDTTHFRIHYDTTGAYAVSEDYARQIAEIAEYSWEIEVDSLGFDAPPPDNGAGGDNRYDIHIIGLTGGVLGYCAPEGEGPDPYQEDFYSYIAVDDNLGGYMKSTVCHEFMHACQFSYTVSDGIWFFENCAVWAEEMVYPDDNTYIGYINGVGPLRRPNYEITHMTNPSDLYEYAGVAWPLFLMFWENDTDIIRTIWDTLGLHWGNYTMRDIDGVLRRDYGDSLENALTEYAAWRWFTGGHWDQWHWSEANLWASIFTLRAHHTYPASGNEGIMPIRGPGGCDCIVFDSWGSADSLFFYFDGEDDYTWKVLVIGYRSGPTVPSDVYEHEADDKGYAAFTVPTLDYDTLVLMPVCINWYNTTPQLSFLYTVDVVGVEEAEGQKGLAGYMSGRTIHFTLPASGQTAIRIYDASGRLAYSLTSEFGEGKNSVFIPGLTSPGVYFWHIGFGEHFIGDKAIIF